MELADMRTIIEMAFEAGLVTNYGGRETASDKLLERFAALVAAAEREKSLQLWMLLDDVDTADDIAKTDEAIYRSLCRQAHAKRWSLLNGDEVDAAIRARGNT
jgi:hypothetical protein